MKRVLDVCLVLAIGVVLLLPPRLLGQGPGDDYLDSLNTDVDAATTIITGHVTNAKPEKNSSTSVILSSTGVRKQAVLKGSLSAETKIISIPGGTVGDLTYREGEFPLLKVGDRVVVLLDGSGDPMPGRFLYRITAAGVLEDTGGATLSDLQGLI